MLRSFKLYAPFAAALALMGCNAGSSLPATIDQSTLEANPIPQWQARNLAHRACPEAGPGEAQCELLILSKSPQDKTPGWGARDIEEAYNLPSMSKGSGEIVAVVDAYDNPNVASDLATYRRYYGLPKGKSTSSISAGSKATIQNEATRVESSRPTSMSKWSRPLVRTARSILSRTATAAKAPARRQKSKP